MPSSSYDDELAQRIRDVLGDDPDVTEKRMFGGVAFLASGNMGVAASGQGGIMVRVAREETDATLAEPGAGPMVMQGREIKGWVRVDGAHVPDEATLEPWVERGMSYARSLPPKG